MPGLILYSRRGPRFDLKKLIFTLTIVFCDRDVSSELLES
jgi:hypothetical protein